jgi:hypothetical protein
MARGIQTFTIYFLSRKKPSTTLSTVGVLSWEDILKNVIIAQTQGMHITPVVTGIAPNANMLSKSSGWIN